VTIDPRIASCGNEWGKLWVYNPMSIYDVELTMLDGSTKKFEEFKDHKVLVVNVASRCGLSSAV